MEGFLAPVALRKIDWEDQSFAVRSFASADFLKASVNRYGMLSPPWVVEKEGEAYTVVDGFKRLRLLCEAGTERAECFVFPEATDRNRLLLQRIEGKLFGSPLNPAEKAQIVSKLVAVLPVERVLREFFPLLRLPPRPEMIEKWCRLAIEDEALLESTASEVICERAALELTDWEEEARRKAVRLLKILRCSASIQLEILERITEIALGQNRERSDILNASQIREILDHSQWNHRQKTQALRDLLYRFRFPKLSAREGRFEAELAKARLPQAVRLIPPRFFEGDQWQLQLSFHHPEELQALLEKTKAFAHSPKLPEIMKPTGSGKTI